MVIDAVDTPSSILQEALSRLLRADAAGISNRAAHALNAAEHGHRLPIADLENEPDLHRELRRRDLCTGERSILLSHWRAACTGDLLRLHLLNIIIWPILCHVLDA